MDHYKLKKCYRTTKKKKMAKIARQYRCIFSLIPLNQHYFCQDRDQAINNTNNNNKIEWRK